MASRRSRAQSRAQHSAAPSRSETLRALGVALICAKVALVPLVLDHSLDMPFVVPKAMLSHGLAYVLAGVLAGLLIAHGRAFLVWSWIHVPVLAFVIANSAAAMFAIDHSLALYGTHARMLGLGSILDLVVLYFGIVMLIRSRKEAVAVVLAALTASFVVLTYELIQLMRLDPFRWSVDSADRPFSTLGQATTLAEYLTVLAVGVCAFAFFAHRIPNGLRLLALAYSGALLAGAMATGTRSALIGLGLGGSVLVLVVCLIHPSRRARALTFVGAMFGTLVLIGVVMISPLAARLATTIDSPVGEDVGDEFVSQLAPSAAARVAFYEIGFEILRERPLLGYGPDNFIVGVPRYRPEPGPWYVRQSLASSPHSWAVHVATSSGVIGLACFLGAALLAFGITLKRRFHPVSAASLAMMSTFLGTGLTTVNELGTDWLFWFPLGAVAAANASHRAQFHEHPAVPATKYRDRRRENSRSRRVAAVLPAVIAIFVAVTGFTSLDASRSAQASHNARLAGNSSRAIDFGLRATRSDPGRAQYWHKLGLAYVASASWHNAIMAFTRASALAPYDVSYIGDLARVHILLLESGDSTARARALELGEQAVRLDPKNPRAHHTRAVVMQVTGNFPEAARSIERALALDPGSTNEALYLTATQVMFSSGRMPEAIRVAREGLAVLGHARRSLGIIVELARALWATGQAAEALSELDLALAIQPNDPAALRLRAEIRATIAR